MAIKVRAHKVGRRPGEMVGYFDDTMKKQGDEFHLANAQEFSNFLRKPHAGWMVVVEASAEEMKELEAVCKGHQVATVQNVRFNNKLPIPGSDQRKAQVVTGPAIETPVAPPAPAKSSGRGKPAPGQ